MPLQNRVTPFGDIVAVSARGMFIGNRGIIHDPATKTLLRRRWATKTWLVCVCEYKGRHRDVMAGRSWTELFFLDEATALAAGHRPCFECRRAAAKAFQAGWVQAKRIAPPKAAEIDAVLHRERLQDRRKRLHALPVAVERLPDGAMLAAGGQVIMIADGHAFIWTAEGYRPAARLPEIEGLITPPSTLGAMAAGYRPVLHPSCTNAGMRDG